MKMEIKIAINRVFWDTDGHSYKSCGLPATFKGDYVVWKVSAKTEKQCEEMAYDLTSDWLSDTYGYCHFGWRGKTIGMRRLRKNTRGCVHDFANLTEDFYDEFGNEGEGRAARHDL